MKKNNIPLTVVEVLVFGGILFALISPLFSSSEEESHQQKMQNTKLLIQNVV